MKKKDKFVSVFMVFLIALCAFMPVASAQIFGYMKKMNLPIPEGASKLDVTIHICSNGRGEGLAGPDNSFAQIIVDDKVKEEKINSSMSYHHEAYYKYEYCENFANTFNISGKDNVTFTIKMNNGARLDFQKAVLGFIGEKIELPQIKGAGYGPFRDGQNPDWGPYPSETDIKEDMPILKYMAESIRTYGVCKGLEKIVPIANEFGLKVSPGAWMCSNYDGNEEEINNLISLAQNHEVETVIVGNEVVLRYENGWDTLTEAELIDYITRVKENVSVSVTTGEPWHIWNTHPDLVNAVDYILLHVHPYWEEVSVNNAANHVVEKYEQIQNKYPHKNVVIGETGWPSEGLPNGEAVPSVENQKHFMDEFLKQAYEKGISFYFFEAFDEKWKTEPNGVGPHWGFYYSNRTAKHSIDSVLPSEDIAVFYAPLWFVDTNGDHVAEDVFGYGFAGATPLVGDFDQDGTEDIAVFCDGLWFVDTNGDHLADDIFGYGFAGATPLVGDFDRDGTDDIAVFSAPLWFVDTNGDQVADDVFGYGFAGATPLVGDINQDGADDIAVFSAPLWFVDTNGDHLAEDVFGYGFAGAIPLVGDINQDGTDDIAVFSAPLWFVDTNGDQVADDVFGYGFAGATPLVGNIG